MRITTIGRPAHISMRLVKKAVNFYGKYLIGPGKTFENLDVTIKFEKIYSSDGDYGYCDWNNELANTCYTIGLDRMMSKKETLLALAHEMVHVKQYAKGEMKDLYRPVRMVRFNGEKYLHEKMDYWEQPWEIEAYGREKGLYFKFLNFIRDGEPENICRASKRIKYMSPSKTTSQKRDMITSSSTVKQN